MLAGFKELNEELAKLDRERAKRHQVAILKAGLTLQAESQKICPVKSGAMRNSATTKAEGTGYNTEVFVSYGVAYALFVHENLEAKHPVGQAKFLEEPARTKRAEILAAYKSAMLK